MVDLEAERKKERKGNNTEMRYKRELGGDGGRERRALQGEEQVADGTEEIRRKMNTGD